MDKEEKEIQTISGKGHELELGGVKITLFYPMKAWRKIKEIYGGFAGIQKSLSEDPIDFILEKLPALLLLGQKEDSSATLETMGKYIDKHTISEMTKKILPVFIAALTDTLPEPKSPENPTKTGTEK
jgi:hypothetical protein